MVLRDFFFSIKIKIKYQTVSKLIILIQISFVAKIRFNLRAFIWNTFNFKSLTINGWIESKEIILVILYTQYQKAVYYSNVADNQSMSICNQLDSMKLNVTVLC